MVQTTGKGSDYYNFNMLEPQSSAPDTADCDNPSGGLPCAPPDSAESLGPELLQRPVEVSEAGDAHRQRRDTDTSEDIDCTDDALRLSLEEAQQADSPAKSDRRKFQVPSDPREYRSALLAAIEADRRVAHLSSTEFELTFETQYTTKVRRTQPGEKIAVVGSLDILGQWNPANSLELEWTPGHLWRLTVVLAEGCLPQFEYKFVCLGPRGVRWEGGSNRCFLPEQFSDVRGPKVIYNLKGLWQV